MIHFNYRRKREKRGSSLIPLRICTPLQSVLVSLSLCPSSASFFLSCIYFPFAFSFVEMGITLLLILAMVSGSAMVEGGTWCVAKSGLSDQALQKALDYACGAGADCVPIQQTGACYSPNTVSAHASYAMNSYFQRKGQAQGSCDFTGTATFSTTDPSYGSCIFPSSASVVGTPTPMSTGGTGNGTIGGGLTPTNPTTSIIGGSLTPGSSSGINNTDFGSIGCIHAINAGLLFSSLFFSGILLR